MTQLKASLFLVVSLCGMLNGRVFILDDGFYPDVTDEEASRVRREAMNLSPYDSSVYPIGAGGVGGLPVPVEPVHARSDDYHHPHKHHYASVGPVYTFVKTDKHANFKWGVRHRVGQEYH